jgi:cytochrome oxidase Cu insertion factor (SCO1/SenC/PrrC family)/mono/diheme cytochrome c family protein
MRTTATQALALAVWALATLAPERARAAPRSSPWGAKYFPNVELVTQDGVKVRFYEDLVRDKHVVVSFIYTRCTKQCGLITANLARVQRELGDRVGKDVFFYSITLDPERDTPAALKRYAEAFKARPGWTFLTGKKEDVQLLRRKFGDLASVEDHAAAINIGNDRVGQWWHTSAIDDPRYLATVIGDWMDPRSNGRPSAKSYAEAPQLAPLSKGHAIFRQRCAACHAPGGQSVGPDLRGVVARRDPRWLARWLKDPEGMLARKDPVATALLAKSGGVAMPNTGLTDAEVDDVIRFLQAPEGPAAASADGKGTAGTR